MIPWMWHFLGVGATLEPVVTPTDACTGNTGAILGPACQLANTLSTPSCNYIATNIVSSAFSAGGIVARSLEILSAPCIGLTNLTDLSHKNVGLVANT